MARSITLAELVERVGPRLGLSWISGGEGASETRISAFRAGSRPSLVGFLNLIHPNRLQIIGEEELHWLDGLDAKTRWETLARIMDARPAAVIVAGNVEVARDLEQAARESNTALLKAERPAWEMVNFLEYRITRALAPTLTLHGVFLEIFTIGVLITGDSGTGKSELALELVSRGHRLIADDAPEFTQITPEVVEGTCPPVLRDYLEVRGLGLLNIRRMFGDTAIKPNKYLRLIIHLHTPTDEPSTTDRLRGNLSQKQVLELDIPEIRLPVLPGRNLAVMAEVAVRDFMLRLKGFDAAREFMERHASMMSEKP
ncbi:MAG: HPr(Ser) kinase/phosphatase [Wenzhouxiangella sp.]|nr:HPr(Ser) kinase/phosphatase [Wenzhouxiangella sp.]